jgi:hypothetical protein
MTLEKIIAALEKANGPSEELDRGIASTLNSSQDKIFWAVLDYTSSLDAALTLVPNTFPYWMVERRDTPLGPMTAEAVVHNNLLFMSGKRVSFDVWGHTPALALCIAALKARQDV